MVSLSVAQSVCDKITLILKKSLEQKFEIALRVAYIYRVVIFFGFFYIFEFFLVGQGHVHGTQLDKFAKTPLVVFGRIILFRNSMFVDENLKRYAHFKWIFFAP